MSADCVVNDVRRLRDAKRQRRLLVGGLAEHGGEVDVARLVARRVRVGEVGGEHTEPLPVQQQRRFVNAEDIVEPMAPRYGLKQELLCRNMPATALRQGIAAGGGGRQGSGRRRMAVGAVAPAAG
jgi:hypothetical protein